MSELASGSNVPFAQRSIDLEATVTAPAGAMRCYQLRFAGDDMVLVFVQASKLVTDTSPAPAGAAVADRTEAESSRSGAPRPKVTWRNPRRVEIEFDDNTVVVPSFGRRWVDAAVKTEAVTDPRTGKPMGLKITGVSRNSPASGLAMKPGDILVSINDQPVHSRADALRILQGLDAKISRVKVVIDRNGLEIVLFVDPRDSKTRRQSRYLRTPETDAEPARLAPADDE